MLAGGGIQPAGLAVYSEAGGTIPTNAQPVDSRTIRQVVSFGSNVTNQGEFWYEANDGNHTGALYTAATGNTSYGELDLADFENMAGQLPAYAEANAAWYIHKVGYWRSMANLVDAAGGNNIADLGRGPERMFLGYPVRFVQVMNSTTDAQVSTAGLCVLGDLQLSSLVGNRQGIRSQVLLEKYADTREIGIIGDERVAINNHTVTDPGDSTAAGPVVVLKTPGS